MEFFYATHRYLVRNANSSVRRGLMDEVDWNSRLIGIKGTRGVGKTSFLLQYAKENYAVDDISCLYINLNNFYFTENNLVAFASTFYKKGGRRLLVDQVFKYPNWSKELKICFETLPELKIVFTGSSVMLFEEDNPEIADIADCYCLRGFSLREYANLRSQNNFSCYSLDEILENHRDIAMETIKKVNISAIYYDYIHHGYYPFFLENINYSENLIKSMNMMLEVDIVYIKQIDQSYLSKIRKLFYLLSRIAPGSPNVSKLSEECNVSRATVMNYMKYLKDARMINMLYKKGESYPKKPDMIYLNNPNMIYPLSQKEVDGQSLRETFFYNQLNASHNLYKSDNKSTFRVDDIYDFKIEENKPKSMRNKSRYLAVESLDQGKAHVIPLWIFGFLY